MICEDGAIEIAVPRDRNSSFEPQIVAKSLPQRRLGGRRAWRVSMIGSSAFMRGVCRFARSKGTFRSFMGSRFHPI